MQTRQRYSKERSKNGMELHAIAKSVIKQKIGIARIQKIKKI